MWKTEVIKSSVASKEQIWAVWTDVENWSVWDSGVESSSIFGAFKAGTLGELKAKNGPKSKFKIIECTENKSFTNRSKLPLCTLDFIHEITEDANSIIISHRIEIKGLLSPLFSLVIGKQQAKDLPYAVESLIKLAENAE